MSRLRRAVLAALCCGGLLALTPLVTVAATADAATQCAAQAGTAYTGLPWAQERLDFVDAWPITRGAGIKVAVIDSGLDTFHPDHITIATTAGKNVMAKPDPPGTADCFKHGTEVSSIIAASRTDSRFLGVAPGATIIPIKQSNDVTGDQAALVRGIRYAVQAGAQVINISLAIAAPRSALTDLEKAVSFAGDRGVVIVAAAGNDGAQSNQPVYPAAYATDHTNVVAVSATDVHDQVGTFSSSGSYVTVAAPGVDVWVPAPNVGYLKESGTSYAAPYVSGTVALMLSADRALIGHPAQVRDRLIATADAPPVAVPSSTYGYGIVNPYLAVTSVADSSPLSATTQRARPVAAPRSPAHPDHRLQHIALAAALSLIGLALIAAIASGVVRAGRRGSRSSSG